MKGAAEGPEAGEADIEADVSHAAVGPSQEVHPPLDAAPLKVAVRRLPECGAKGSDEVRLRGGCDSRELGDVKGFGIGDVHRIPGTEHPPVGFLACTGHRVMIMPNEA